MCSSDLESQTPLRPSLPFRVRIAALSSESDGLSRRILTWVITLFLLTMLTVFGAIHCLAWNSPFPTHTERILWRVCAPIVTVAPVVVYLTGAANDAKPGWKTGKEILDVLLLLAYCFARICLLVISLTSLRTLPYKAYENPSWSLFVPHIS